MRLIINIKIGGFGMRSFEEIERMNFRGMTSEEKFKELLGISDEQWDNVWRFSSDATDENTPEGLRDVRIRVNVLTEDGEEVTIAFDLVYEVDEIEYEDGYVDYEYKDLVDIIYYSVM